MHCLSTGKYSSQVVAVRRKILHRSLSVHAKIYSHTWFEGDVIVPSRGLGSLSMKHACPASCLNAAIRRVADCNSWCCVRSVAIKRGVLAQEGDEETTKVIRSHSRLAGNTIRRRAVILPVTSQWIIHKQVNVVRRVGSEYVNESYLRDQTVAFYIHSCKGHGGRSWRPQGGVDSVNSLVNRFGPLFLFQPLWHLEPVWLKVTSQARCTVKMPINSLFQEAAFFLSTTMLWLAVGIKQNKKKSAESRMLKCRQHISFQFSSLNYYAHNYCLTE